MRLGRASLAVLFATALIVVSGRHACAGESAAQSSQVAGEAQHTQSSQSFGAVSAYEGLIVKSIDKVGSSTEMRSSATGCSGQATVSPISGSGRPVRLA